MRVPQRHGRERIPQSMGDDAEVVVRSAANHQDAHEYELVLLSQGLTPRLHAADGGIVITVPRNQAARAGAALAAYDGETRARRPRVADMRFELATGVSAGLFLLGFFAMSNLMSGVPWLERGSANAAKIIEGEVWRSITALTLHADIAHALGNACALAIFLAALAGQCGGGMAVLAVLLSGAAGNLGNAYLRGAPHDGIGASTAVFGALGIIGVLALARRRRGQSPRRAWVALAASLALLGMLGGGGARVDVMAHVLGFVAGAVLAGAVALNLGSPPGAKLQCLCGATAAVLIVGCWLAALR
jgi:membrane associated rhomboid family serine protease